MNRNRFCWPRCLLLGAGLIVIGVVTIAVFVPAWVWAVLFGIGLVAYREGGVFMHLHFIFVPRWICNLFRRRK